MVTPRKPNAKRGRPANPKPPKLPSQIGRPREPLHLHPQRYAVAALDAAATLFGSERKASRALWAAAWGEPVELDAERPEMARLSVPMSLEDFRKAADNLRKLAAWYTSPSDLVWRLAIAQAILIAMKLGPAADQTIIARAEAVGEGAWARHNLLPLLKRTMPAGERENLARIFADFLSQLAG